jgi:hypothetical protein
LILTITHRRQHWRDYAKQEFEPWVHSKDEFVPSSAAECDRDLPYLVRIAWHAVYKTKHKLMDGFGHRPPIGANVYQCDHQSKGDACGCYTAKLRNPVILVGAQPERWPNIQLESETSKPASKAAQRRVAA